MRQVDIDTLVGWLLAKAKYRNENSLAVAAGNRGKTVALNYL